MKKILLFALALTGLYCATGQTLEKSQSIMIYDTPRTLPPSQFGSERMFVRSDSTEYRWDGFDWVPWYDGQGCITNLQQDSILVRSCFGSEVDRDTVRLNGSGQAVTSISADSVVLNGLNYEVAPADNLQDFADKVDLALLNARSTGVRTGGVATIDGGPGGSSNVSFTAGSGQILDNSDPNDLMYYPVDWAAQNSIPLATTSPPLTYWYVDSLGAIQQQTTTPTGDERRTKVYLAVTSYTTSVGAITGIAPIVTPVQHTPESVEDISDALGAIKRSGLQLSSAGTGLAFRVTSGLLFSYGSAWNENEMNPHNVSYNEFNTNTGGTFRNTTLSGVISTDETLIDVANYQSGGVVTAIPGNVVQDRFGKHYVFVFPGTTPNYRVVYGTDFYTSPEDAAASLSYQDAISGAPAGFEEFGILLGAIIAEKDETTNANFVFVSTNKFGLFGGALVSAAQSDAVQTIQAGAGISVDATDPANPIVTNTAPNTTPNLSQVLAEGTSAGGQWMEDVQFISFGPTEISPWSFYQSGDELRVKESGAPDAFAFNPDYDTDISIARKQDIDPLLGQVDSITAGAGISIDNTDPDNPIIINTAPNIVQDAEDTAIDPIAGLPASSNVQQGLNELSTNLSALDQIVGALRTLSGMPLLSENFGTFTGTILPDNQAAKPLYQLIEDELQAHLDSIAALRGDIGSGGGGLTGTLTERYIPVADATGNLEDGIIFQGSRGIGIGTTDLSGPFDERLVIRGDLSGTSGRTAIILENNNTTSASIFSMLNADGQRLSMQNSANGYSTGAIGSVGTNNGLDLFFTTGGNSPTGGTGDFAMRLGGFSVTPQFTINLAGGSGVDKPANVGIMTTDPQYTLDVSTTGGVRLGSGTTAERGVGTAGYLNWNTTTGAWDGHNGTSFGRSYLSSDVTPQNGQVRVFNSSTGMYEPTDLAAAGMSSFTITADTGTPNTITDGETLTHTGGQGIITTVTDNTITDALALGQIPVNVTAQNDQFFALYDSSDGQNWLMDIDVLSSYINTQGSGIYGGSGTVPDNTTAITGDGAGIEFLTDGVNLVGAEILINGSLLRFRDTVNFLLPAEPYDRALATGTDFRSWYTPEDLDGGRIVGITYSLETPGTGNVIVQITNGTINTGAATIPVGGVVHQTANISLTASEKWTPSVFSISGTGHEGLSLQFIIERQ